MIAPSPFRNTFDDVTIAFQPIIRFTADGTQTVAFEALARVRGAQSPAALFQDAARRGRLAELNVLLVARAIAAAAKLPESAQIFINVDPIAFGEPDLVARIDQAIYGAQIAPERIVLEVTEHSPFEDCDTAQAMGAFDELRARGIRFALDDHGSAHLHLAWIDRIRPSFVKISTDFGTGFESDHAKKRVVQDSLALAGNYGCEMILEGIETGATDAAARAIGVPLAQGFLYGHAREAMHWQNAA